MATRMMTLLYGDKPEADVEPGNRVDTADDVPPASLPPMPSMEHEAHAPHTHHFALRGVVLGLAAAAAVLLVAAGTAYVAGSTTHTAR